MSIIAIITTTDSPDEAVLELHSYHLPAIVAFEIAQAYGPYAEWVADSVSGAQG